MTNIYNKITIDDDSCMHPYPCKHNVILENDGNIRTVKMKADEIFYLCCKNNLPVANHIKDGFINTMYEKHIVHIRIIQTNGRKKITICQGLMDNINLNKVLKALQRNFNVGGAIINHPEYGNVVQLQGNHATNIKLLLVKSGLCNPNNVHIHGE